MTSLQVGVYSECIVFMYRPSLLDLHQEGDGTYFELNFIDTP